MAGLAPAGCLTQVSGLLRAGRLHVVHELVDRVAIGECVVDLDERLPFVGQRVLRKDRLDGALGLARAAVDALLGVDDEDAAGLVDAVHGADVDAGAVFDVDAGLGDDVRHGGLLYRRKQSIDQFPPAVEQRRFGDDLIESGGMSATKTRGVRVVREPENRDLRVVVRDVVGIDARDVSDHEIGRLDPVGGLEAVLRQERFELAPDEEVDPTEQDRRHA